jgi:uroporphyrin-III C-methyltransferase/precorrin-2 dehydrogenase/sirohydrochlorin ferrochelatase
MGLHGLETLCQQLIAHGRSANTPVAIVQQGTTQHQKVVIGTLRDIYAKATAAKLKAPTLVVVGSVVTLHEKLAWFHPEEQAAEG